MTRTTFFPSCLLPRVALAGFAAVALFLVACGGAPPPATTTAPTQTATPGGNVRAGQGFIATLIPLTEAPSTVAPATVTREVTAASRGGAATTGGGGMGTWTAPDGGISLQYPAATWQATPTMTTDGTSLRLDGPNNQVIFVRIATSDTNGPAPSPSDVLQLLREDQAHSAQFTYTYGTTRDITVGGAPARYLEYQYTPTANRTAVAAQGAVWAIQRVDRTYVLRASNIGIGRPDVDAIIASVSYPPTRTIAAGAASPRPSSILTSNAGTGTPALTATAPLVRGTSPPLAPPSTITTTTTARTASPPSSTMPAPSSTIVAPSTTAAPMAAQQGPATFADPNTRVAFQFPQDWKFINPNADAATFFEFDGPDAAHLFVGINDGTDSLDDVVRAYRDTQRQIMVFTYIDGGTMDVRVGGEPGKLVMYTYVPQDRPGDPSRNGAAWIVIRSGKVFTFDARDIGTHRAEVDVIIASIRFTK